MAKKNGLLKVVVGVGAAAVAGKVAYNKYKATKEEFDRQEKESADYEVKKYNSIFGKKYVEIEDEEFKGCEVKAIGSKTVLDLGLAVFEKDVYINFESIASAVSIILPEGVNVTCDVEKKLVSIRNLVENVEEDGIHTVYIIGKATLSNLEIIPVNFYVDDDLGEEGFEDEEAFPESEPSEVKIINEAEPKAEKPKAEESKTEEPKAEKPEAEALKTEEPEAEKPEAKESKAEKPKKKKDVLEEQTETISLEEV